jgi:hypothetical protein
MADAMHLTCWNRVWCLIQQHHRKLLLLLLLLLLGCTGADHWRRLASVWHSTDRPAVAVCDGTRIRNFQGRTDDWATKGNLAVARIQVWHCCLSDDVSCLCWYVLHCVLRVYTKD